MKDNATIALARLVTELGIPISQTAIEKKAQVASHLLSLQGNGDSSIKNAMHDWYHQKQKNYEDWADNHPVKKSVTTIDQLQKQREWCKMTEIAGTPTLFINGRRLPKFYEPEDLKYFI